MEKLPIYRFVVDENDEAEVTAVALVDDPAIELNWIAFKTQFETYNDYPKKASQNAKRALELRDKYKLDCGTQVGWTRANQLANGENISRETIARMSAFERHRENSKGDPKEDCGALMWLAWGGDEGIEWASRKLQQIDLAAEKISFDFDETLTTQRGYDMAKKLVESGANVYIISARKDTSEIMKVADELRIPKSNVYATGSNNSKIEKIKELGIKKHYDNNESVVKKLEGIGVKFVIEPKDDENESEFMARCISTEMDNGYEQDQAIAICSSKWGGFKKYKFKADKEKRIISGVLMVADLPIYRRDSNGFEYYGLFTAQDIYNIRNKFFKKGYINEVNKMHNPNEFVDGVYMVESFIIDSKRGINAPDGLQLPDGSWFGSYKVDNEDVWNNFIKTGEFKGFSVEGDFRIEKLGDKPLTTIEQMIDIIKQIDDHQAKQNALDELNSMVKRNINIA